MKKYIPLILAVIVFGVALALNQPETQASVVVAAIDLPEGRTLSESDLMVKQMPQSLAPAGAVDDPRSLVGQRLRIARSAGDPILPAQLGGETLELAPDERAVAVQVNAASGLAGLLKAGDRVGLTVIVTANQQTFAKYLAGGLRVLWVDPIFRREEAPVQATPQSGSGGVFGGGASPAVSDTSGSAKGLVVLAIPTDARLVAYDFGLFNAENGQLPVNLVDLIPVLSTQGAQFGLLLEPEGAKEIVTGGIAVQSIAITPGATLTPTPTGAAGVPDSETGSTPEPTKKP